MSRSSSSRIAPEEGDAVRVNVSLLPGFGFSPTDELLVSYYLKNKIEGTDSHFRHVIPEIDLSEYEPDDIAAFLPKVHEKESFFFTRPKYKNTHSTRRDRLAADGYYKVTGDEREIKAEGSEAVIGKKIILPFHKGRGPKAKKSDWVIHEYYCTETEVGSEPTKQMDFVLCRLKNKSAGYKKPKGNPTRGELADSGANPEDDQAAAASDVIAGPVEHLGYKELGHVNYSESPDGSCSINWNDILTIFNGDDETGSCKISDVEFCSALGEIPNSTSQPPQTPEPHQPPHSHQPQDYYPSTYQPPLHTTQDYYPSTHQPPLHTTQDYYPSTHQPHEYIISTNDPNEPVSKPNGVQDLAIDEMIPEDCFHPDEFMGLPFDPSQDYLLPSPMNMELGDGVHPEPHQPPHSHQPQDYYPSTYQPPLHTTQDYYPSTHQPPLHTTQDYYPATHQPPLHTTQDYYPSTHQPHEYIISTNDPNEPVSKPNGVQDLATDEMIPEDWFHPDEFMGLPFDPSQDYLLPSPMNMELGDGVHPNNLYWMH